jgi:hypothetical protein
MTRLPEPKHPFARWCAGAAISLWALVVQDFSSPLNKVGAILSPAVGYLLGHALDRIIYHASQLNNRRTHNRALKENKATLDRIYFERQQAIELGTDLEIIKLYDSVLSKTQKDRILLIEKTPTLQKQ